MSFPVRLLCFACGDVATLGAHTYLERPAGIHFQAAMLRGIVGEGIDGSVGLNVSDREVTRGNDRLRECE